MARKKKGEVVGAIVGITVGVSMIAFVLRTVLEPQIGVGADVIVLALVVFAVGAVGITLLELTPWGAAHVQRRLARSRGKQAPRRETAATE